MVTVNDQDPKFPPKEAPYLKLFTSPTTNGRKITIFLELLGIDYIFRPTDYALETKEPWYLKINPNGKVPAISKADADGKLFNLAESGALLLWLAQTYDTAHKYSYAPTSNEHWEEVEFLFFHASDLGAAQTAYNKNPTPETEAALLKKYTILENQLKSTGSGFLVGNHISLADVIAIAHAKQYKDSAADTSSFPLFNKWVDTLYALPAVQAAYNKK